MEGVDRAAGFRGLIGAIGATVAEIARSRLELFSLELQEEKIRLIRLLVMTAAALFCGGMAFVLLNVTLVYLFWETARLTVLVSLTVFYALLLAGLAFGLMRSIARHPLPFAETLREFRKDRECFRGKS